MLMAYVGLWPPTFGDAALTLRSSGHSWPQALAIGYFAAWASPAWWAGKALYNYSMEIPR